MELSKEEMGKWKAICEKRDAVLKVKRELDHEINRLDEHTINYSKK